MRDEIRIEQRDSAHYEIVRTMRETVNRSNLEERLRSLNLQIEAVKDQLDLLERNRKVLEDALKTGKGEGGKEIMGQKSV